MDTLSALILVLCLAGLIGLPVMMMRSLVRSAEAPVRPDRAGWLLRASPASYYAAAFCLLAPLGVAARLRMGAAEYGFSVWNEGPLAGIIFAAFATLVAMFLAVRARLRTTRYDDEGITAWGRRHRWADLTGAGLGRASAVEARFIGGARVVVRMDMEGRAEFEKFLRKAARRAGLRWGHLEN